MSDEISIKLAAIEKTLSDEERERFLQCMEEACGENYTMRAGFRRGWLAQHLTSEDRKEL